MERLAFPQVAGQAKETTVPKRRLGPGQSGDPSRRFGGKPFMPSAAQLVHRLELAGELWPFAFDYFSNSSRIGIFADVPVVDAVKGGRAVDLHGLVTVPIAEVGRRIGADRLAVVATVRQQDGSLAVIWSQAADLEPALTEVLTDLTALFLNELGPKAHAYTQQALQERPVLGSPSATRELLLPLIHHRMDNRPTPEG